MLVIRLIGDLVVERTRICLQLLKVYGHFLKRSFLSKNKELFRSLAGAKNKSIQQISGVERHLKRNDHDTK